MKKTLFTVSMILLLMCVLNIAAFAKNVQYTFIDYDVKVINPSVKWVGHPKFDFTAGTELKSIATILI